MERIYEVDKDVRIKVIYHNYILQRKIKKRNKQIAWRSEGYFSDLVSLSLEYLENAPRRAVKATERFEKLIEVIKTAEKNIINKLIKKDGQN